MALENAFGPLMLDDTGKDIQRGAPDHTRRYEWELVGGKNKPKYIGVAPLGADENDDHDIVKFTWVLGPDGVNYVPETEESATGAWTDRGILLP